MASNRRLAPTPTPCELLSHLRTGVMERLGSRNERRPGICRGVAWVAGSSDQRRRRSGLPTRQPAAKGNIGSRRSGAKPVPTPSIDELTADADMPPTCTYTASQTTSDARTEGFIRCAGTAAVADETPVPVVSHSGRASSGGEGTVGRRGTHTRRSRAATAKTPRPRSELPRARALGQRTEEMRSQARGACDTTGRWRRMIASPSSRC